MFTVRLVNAWFSRLESVRISRDFRVAPAMARNNASLSQFLRIDVVREKHMKWIPVVCLVALAGCTSSPRQLEPIPGSITYGGQPRTKLTKSPIGSVVTNRLLDENGRQAEEVYVIQPDRSLKLVSRRLIEDDFFPR